MRWFRRGLAALLLIGLLAAAVLAAYAWRTLPTRHGSMTLAGAKGEIRIERDVHGIPTIVAAHALDAYFGLGVAHAQDRLWQLETHRRIGSGSTAEAFGPLALDGDRFLRALGVRRAAEAQWARVPAATRSVVEAYAAGINAVIAQGEQARAPEFLILGLAPGRWEPADSLAWAIMMAWDLGGNWGTEMLRLRLSQRMPAARVEQMLPPYPGDPVPPGADYGALYRSLGLGADKVAALTRGLDAAPESGVEGVGSNNWVLAGSRTTTGAPLLANDPHLKLSAPALWYFARLKAPGLDVAGATMPGLPMVVLGQNANIAWGFTNTGPDVQDLYLEQFDPADPGRVRTPTGFEPLISVTETLRVRGGADVPINVRRSRHGPLISDAGGMAGALGGRDPKTPTAPFGLALRWTALDPDNDAITAGLAIQAADSVEAFFQAVRGFVAPMKNMVVADRAGHIVLVPPGRVPIRGPAHDLGGRAPAPGWDARYDWVGFVPEAALPRRRDPAAGWIATANQRITEPGYPHHITHEWALPYRQQRIEQLLQSRPQHALQDLAAMQMDAQSLAVQKLLPWLRRAESPHPLAAAAQAQLQGFDGRMDADRAAPLIAWAWQRQLARGVFADDAGEAIWNRSLATRSFQDALEGVLARDDVSWCDERSTAAVETCAQQSGLALTRALDDLAQRHGSDVAAWRWGDAHVARSEHRPFSQVPVLHRVFELRSAVGGDTHTVMAMRVGLRPDKVTGDLFHVDHSASLRAVYDLADRRRSGVVHSTGQSGILFSRNYRDFVVSWTQGALLPLWPQGEPAAVLTVRPPPS